MPPSLILCERTSRWAAAFRRELRKSRERHAVSMQEVRSLAECYRELAASPYSVVAVELLPQNLSSATKALRDWSRRYPHARFLALAARGLEPHELLMREAGAIHVTFSPRALSPVLRLIRRHLDRAPKDEQTLEESIWAQLPWTT